MPSQVQCYFVEEKDSLRHGNNAPATSLLARLAGFVKRALGHVTPDKDERNLYHLTEGNLVVRSVVAIDGFVAHSLTLKEIYEKTVSSHIKAMLVDQKDVVVVVAGHAGCTKSRTLHGPHIASGGLLAGGQLPVMADWGMVLFALRDLLQSTSDVASRMDGVLMNGYELMVSTVRLQLGNIADCLVPRGSVKSTSQDFNALRNQYLRLLTIASSSILEMEETNGSFSIPDAVELPIKGPEDIAHFANCIALLRTTSKYYGLAGRKRGSPFHIVVTVKCAPVGGQGETRYLQFVELAEMDWESSLPTDTAVVRQEIDHMYKMLCSLQEMADRRGELSGPHMERVKSANRLPERCASTLRSRSNSHAMGSRIELSNLEGLQRVELLHLRRATPLSRLVFSHLDPFNSHIVFAGHSLFSKVPQIMDVIAGLKNEKVRLSFEGPNGEGYDEIDDELRHHVSSLQRDSESLRSLYLDAISESQRLKAEVKGKLAEYKALNQRLQTVAKTLTDETRQLQKEAIEMLHDSRDEAILRSMLADKESKRRELEDLMRLHSEDQATDVVLQGRLRQEITAMRERNSIVQAEVDDLHTAISAKESAHKTLTATIQEVSNQVTERMLEYVLFPPVPGQQETIVKDAIRPDTPPPKVVPTHEMRVLAAAADTMMRAGGAAILRAGSDVSELKKSTAASISAIKSLLAGISFVEGISTSESQQYFSHNPPTHLSADADTICGNGCLNQCRARQWADYIDREWIPKVSSGSSQVSDFAHFESPRRAEPAGEGRYKTEFVPQQEQSVVRRRLQKDMQFAAVQKTVTEKSKQRLRALKGKSF